MEKNTKLIIAAVGLGGLGYFLYKKGFFSKKSAPAPMVILPTTDGNMNQYPIAKIVTSSQEGRQPTGKKVQLKDGDAVKGVPETVYVLKGGEKHPVTGAWWTYNFGEDWSNLINTTDTTLDIIPTGSLFSINGK
jgi:hypothetical protein